MGFKEMIQDELNSSVTENGAIGYKTTKKEIVDFNFKISSYRNKSEEEIEVDFKKVWFENKELAFKYLFFLRDAREGVGERRLFRICLRSLIENDQIVNNINHDFFNLIAEFGRYDDIIALLGINEKTDKLIFKYVKDTLAHDLICKLEGEPVSLLAKWLPSINTSSQETRALAKKIIKGINTTEKKYRKMLSELRAYLDVVEVKCCSNKWEQIKYENVPSYANLKYKEAFVRHDPERRAKYLESLNEGKTTINSKVVFPHDIINKYNKEYDITLENMWKALPNYLDQQDSILVVRDGSGSMTRRIGKSNICVLDVATALSIYFSERCKGPFKDCFITFSARPELINFTGYESLYDKLKLCNSYNECSNTNIEATFDLILQTAIKNKLEQKDLPNLLIISDMEFDQATALFDHEQKTLFDTIKTKFKYYGYNLPKLIFWNVNSRTHTIPITENESGVCLVSGFSPTITKLVLSSDKDPYNIIVKELSKERYKKIILK